MVIASACSVFEDMLLYFEIVRHTQLHCPSVKSDTGQNQGGRSFQRSGRLVEELNGQRQKELFELLSNEEAALIILEDG